MEFDAYLDHVREHAAALRAAAVQAGPDADVPTTPGWDVRQLVRHIARVHDWVMRCLDTEPTGNRPGRTEPPKDWDGLLAFWDETLDRMLAELRRLGPDAPVWSFDTKHAGFWARRQAHETAIHRLDAEHAAHGDAVDHLVFPSDLAADGVDEALTVMVARSVVDVSGTVLYHAADAGRAWLVTAEAGTPPEIGAVDQDSGLGTDASVVGTADAVYRAVWGRPSTAIIGGDRTIVAALRTP